MIVSRISKSRFNTCLKISEQKENHNPYNEQSRGKDAKIDKYKIDATNSRNIQSSYQAMSFHTNANETFTSELVFNVDQQLDYKLHDVKFTTNPSYIVIIIDNVSTIDISRELDGFC